MVDRTRAGLERFRYLISRCKRRTDTLQTFVIPGRVHICLDRNRIVCRKLSQRRQVRGVRAQEKYNRPDMAETTRGSGVVVAPLQADRVPCPMSCGSGHPGPEEQLALPRPMWRAGATCSNLSFGLQRIRMSEAGRGRARGHRISTALFTVPRH